MVYWWGLIVVFLYIALDEFVSIHEEMSTWFTYDGVLYFGWVIPASERQEERGSSLEGFRGVWTPVAVSRRGFVCTR